MSREMSSWPEMGGLARSSLPFTHKTESTASHGASAVEPTCATSLSWLSKVEVSPRQGPVRLGTGAGSGGGGNGAGLSSWTHALSSSGSWLRNQTPSITTTNAPPAHKMILR